jgi:hypothetical protein
VSGYGFHWSRCRGGGAGAGTEIILIAGAVATVWMLPRLAWITVSSPGLR